MDTELFELCKEVYKRTDWDNKDLQHELYQDYRPDLDVNVPLYTSDFLLKKLPKKFGDKTDALGNFDCVTNLFVEAIDNGRWQAYYRGLVLLEEADTPLKALLKLVVALDDAGELK